MFQPFILFGTCEEGSCSLTCVGLAVLIDAAPSVWDPAYTHPRSHLFQCLSTHQLLRALPAASGMSQKGSYSASPSAGCTVCSSPAQSTQLSRPQRCQALNPEEPFSPQCCSGLIQQLLLGCRYCSQQLL